MVVKRSYSIWFYRITIGIFGLFLLGIPLLAVLPLLIAREYNVDPWSFVLQSFIISVPIGLLGLALSWAMRRALREAQQYDAVRQATARGEGKTASLQEVVKPNTDSPLTLPWEVRLRLYWSNEQRWIAAGLFGVLQIGVIIIPFVLPSDETPLWEAILLTEGLFLLVWLLTGLLLTVTLRSRLAVTEASITSWELGGKNSVQWDEAKLFAILRNGFIELASAKGRVILHPNLDPIHAWLRPDVSFAEYQAKMATLLLLIHERTGLPLMDLRTREIAS